MMPDDIDAANNLRPEERVAELVGRVGNCYVRTGLSPPSQLHSAAKHWLGLSVEEIVDVVKQHFDRHRHSYTCGSGDQLFHILQADIKRAWQAKHPVAARADDEPERPQRPRRRIMKIHSPAGGPADVLVDDPRADRLFGDPDQAAPVERPSGLPGYERSGDPIDDDGGGAA